MRRLPGTEERRSSRPTGDAGAAVPEFLMVSVLLIFLTVLIVQAALYLYVRNIVTAAAAEGARYAADANVDPASGAERAQQVTGRGTSRSVADRLPCRGAEEPGGAGATLDVVRCSGSLPFLFLPGFGVLPIRVQGHAIEEGP